MRRQLLGKASLATGRRAINSDDDFRFSHAPLLKHKERKVK